MNKYFFGLFIWIILGNHLSLGKYHIKRLVNICLIHIIINVFI